MKYNVCHWCKRIIIVSWQNQQRTTRWITRKNLNQPGAADSDICATSQVAGLEKTIIFMLMSLFLYDFISNQLQNLVYHIYAFDDNNWLVMKWSSDVLSQPTLLLIADFTCLHSFLMMSNKVGCDNTSDDHFITNQFLSSNA